LLEENYDLLLKADKNRKDNRTGKQDICRMAGSITQSYFLLDAPQYKVGRKIYYNFDDEVRALEVKRVVLTDSDNDEDANFDLKSSRSRISSRSFKGSKYGK